MTKLHVDCSVAAAQPDFVRGSREIGEVLGIGEKAAHNLIASGALSSVKKIGGRYWASRSKLIREVAGE